MYRKNLWLYVCLVIYVCRSVCECVHLPTSPHLDWYGRPPTCRSARVWLIWAEVVVTSWTGVDFLSSPNTDLVFIISSVSCLYVFIDQLCYGRREGGRRRLGTGSEKGGREKKERQKKKEGLKPESAAFSSLSFPLPCINHRRQTERMQLLGKSAN